MEDSNDNKDENLYNINDFEIDIDINCLNITENFDISNEIISKIIKQNGKMLEYLRVKDFWIFKRKLSINSCLIYSQWKRSFSFFSYNKQNEYKKLVKFDQEMITEKMSDILKEIEGENTFEFYNQDAKSYSGMINSLEKEICISFIIIK